MGDRTWRTGLPDTYAREKHKALVKRWNGKLGAALAAMTPVAWAGVSPMAFLGFTGFSTGPTENTTEAVPGQSFHELGYFQVEGGMRDGPAPNPDPRAKYNAWGLLAATELVQRLLNGRPATMKPGAWKQAIDDQAAVGLANLLRHLANARRQLPESLHPRDPASTWAVLLSFTAFSRGSGQLQKVIAPYAAKLGEMPEAERWTAFESMVAADIAKGAAGIGARTGKMGAAYAIVRSRQKHDCGKLVAASLGTEVDRAWFLSSDPERDAILARAAYNG